MSRALTVTFTVQQRGSGQARKEQGLNSKPRADFPSAPTAALLVQRDDHGQFSLPNMEKLKRNRSRNPLLERRSFL